MLKTFRVILLFCVGVPWFAGAALAATDYLSALKLANEYVTRQKSLIATPDALSSGIVRSLLGRYYEVGDSWDVIASQQSPILSPVVDPADVEKNNETIGVFHYEVVEVRGSGDPLVRVRITQKSSFGYGPVDPRVQALLITTNDRLLQNEKSYVFENSSSPLAVSPLGLKTRASLLDLFPLDFPDVVTAQGMNPVTPPALPKSLQAALQKAGVKPAFADGQWFDQDDFFGRPIQVFWKNGDPWPTYLKTANGVAILLNKRVL